MSFNPDIVVVGGGPIGLWTAIQSKALTDKEVLVIEKYPEYKRAGINLRIKAASLKGLPDIESLRPLKELVKKWGKKSVPIQTLEEELTRCANLLGVKILKGEAADPKTLQEQYPSAKVFIGADGARSDVRKELFGNEYKFNTSHQYIVQAQYRIRTPSKNDWSEDKIKKAANIYIKQKFAGHLIMQTVRPLEDGTSQVTLRIFVKEETYNKMADATFGNPYYFEEKLTKVPEELREILIKWWGDQYNQEIITEVEKTNKLTVIPLASYAAKKAFQVKKNHNEEDVVIALAGDALQAYPFFRAINNGFLIGTKLSKCIGQAFKTLEKSESDHKQKADKNFIDPFRSYSRYSNKRACIEKTRACVKNMFLIISSLWIKVSRSVPWQTVKWSKEKKARFYEQGCKVWTQLTGEVPPPPAKKKRSRKKVL